MPIPQHRLGTSPSSFDSSIWQRRETSTKIRKWQVTARNSPQTSGKSRLIIPGGDRSQQSSQTNRIIIPGQDRNSGSIETSGVQLPSSSQYRPPPGFMDAQDSIAQPIRPLDQAEARNALDRIRMSTGSWHELAGLFPGLSAAGYDAVVVEQETGLARAAQSVWAIAQQVLVSLQKGDSISSAELAYFDREDGAHMLYYLRMLPVTSRPRVAAYLVQQQLSAMEAEVLARAVKEQERRNGEKEGFSDSPADCLAYKYYRDAIESRVTYTRHQLIQKGIATADSRLAVQALEQLLEEKPERIVGNKDEQEATLEVVRLTGDEVEFRPVPVVGELSCTTAASVAAAVGVSQSGPFNSFTITPESTGQQFVALPTFRSLLLARNPVAFSIEDCAQIPAVLASTNTKTKEDKLRQSGPGLLLINRHLDSEARLKDVFYVRAKGEGCELVAGKNLQPGEEVCGVVLFLCRPPARSIEAKLNSYALMSV